MKQLQIVIKGKKIQGTETEKKAGGGGWGEESTLDKVVKAGFPMR